ncbi:MAG: hypothetical protein IJF78_13945 [Clostridia bacterium]|nr:hypothetical protein [Clostridia bacterium]
MKFRHFIPVLLAAFLLFSCVSEPELQTYTNDESLCQMGDTLYLCRFLPQILNGSLPAESRLCRDPLCRHQYNDFGCPESSRFSDILTEFRTDGETLYMLTSDTDAKYEYYKQTGIKAQLRQIYALDLTAGSMREIASYEASNFSYGADFWADDGYIYYKQGYILDPEGVDASSQCVRIMRVKNTGSAPEDILGEDLDPTSNFIAEDGKIYLNRSDSRDLLEIIDPETGETVSLSTGGRAVRRLAVMNSTVYAVCFDGELSVTGSETEHTIFTYAVYRADGGSLTCIAENISAPVFSGGSIWYSTPEAQFHGVVKPEMASPFDLLSHSAGDLIRLDPISGETMRWRAEKHIEPIGYSAGYVLANLIDYEEYAVSGEKDETVYKLTLNDDGTVMVDGEFEEAEK